MTVLIFFISLAVFVTGLIGAFSNMAFLMTSDKTIETSIRLHFLFGLLYVLGGLSTLICGIVWLVQTLAELV